MLGRMGRLGQLWPDGVAGAAGASGPFTSNNVTQAVSVDGTCECPLPAKNHTGGALAVNDTIYVIAAGTWGVAAEAGFTDLNDSPGSFWNGRAMKKTLTAGDISAGQVVIDFGGGSGEYVTIVAMAGNPTLRTSNIARVASAATAESLTTSGTAPVAGDLVFLAGTARTTAGNVTCNRGTPTHVAISNGNGIGRPFGEVLGAGGHFSTTWTFDAAINNAAYLAVLVFVP